MLQVLKEQTNNQCLICLAHTSSHHPSQNPAQGTQHDFRKREILEFLVSAENQQKLSLSDFDCRLGRAALVSGCSPSLSSGLHYLCTKMFSLHSPLSEVYRYVHLPLDSTCRSSANQSFYFFYICREDGFAIFIGSAANAANPKALAEVGIKYPSYSVNILNNIPNITTSYHLARSP